MKKGEQMGKKKLLVVSAHAADWCTRSGGTILKFIRAGYEANVILLTFGENGESGGYWMKKPGGTYEECKQVRIEEVKAAFAVMGIEKYEFMDWGDYPLDINQERLVMLTDKIAEYTPDVVFTHSPYDVMNQDHSVTSRAVTRAVTCAGAPGRMKGLAPRGKMPDLFFFEAGVPHTEFNGFKFNNLVDISDTFEQKMKAVECFSPSQGQLVGLYTDLNKRRASQAAGLTHQDVTYAEAFERWQAYVGDILPVSHIEKTTVEIEY